ncbi:ABC transporter permease [Pseudomonas oryzihabitans]|uniref:ABC transporter permease n=1 Tax=Pseudomonas oryzihabitans TaxID=47885 RepID=UPI0011A29B82|nr:ABC transporter permease [Pseudomonas psychrotolerans]
MFGLLRGIWSYRHFITSSIKNDFVSRFARSRLGGLWMIINPLAQVAIYALILSNVLAAKLPGVDNKYAYALYLMAGILGWNLFSEIVSRCLGLFIEQGNLMKKMRFPRICLPVIVTGSCLVNYFFLLLSMLLVFALLDSFPGIELLWLIPLTLAALALALGVGLILGVLNVFVRDIGQVVPILLQIWFWFTPIVYPVHIVPESVRGFISYNPMYPIITGFQNVLVYGHAPDTGAIAITLGISLLLLLLGLFIFRRAAPEMVDAL